MADRREQGHPGERIVISSTMEPPALSATEREAVAAIRERRRQEDEDRARRAAGHPWLRWARAARCWLSVARPPASRDHGEDG